MDNIWLIILNHGSRGSDIERYGGAMWEKLDFLTQFFAIPQSKIHTIDNRVL